MSATAKQLKNLDRSSMGLAMIKKGRASRKSGAVHELKIGLVLDGVESLKKLAAKLELKMDHPDTEPGAAVKYAVAIARIYEKISKSAESIPDMIDSDPVPHGQIPSKPNVIPACPSNLAAPTTLNILINEHGNGNANRNAGALFGRKTEVVLPEGGGQPRPGDQRG